MRTGWPFASSIRSRSCAYARWEALLGDDRRQPVAGSNLRAGGRGEQAAREDDAELDELVRRDVAPRGASPCRAARDVAVHPGRMPPDAVERRSSARPGSGIVEASEPRPDGHSSPQTLQVDVDDVVVGDRQPAEAVRDRERALLVLGPVVPDDPHALRAGLHAERARRAEAAELGARARDVVVRALAHADVVDRLALAERDVPVRAAESPEKSNVICSRRAATPSAGLTATSASGSVYDLAPPRRGREQRGRGEGDEAPCEPAQLENCTAGASRAAPSVSKYALRAKAEDPTRRCSSARSRARCRT